MPESPIPRQDVGEVFISYSHKDEVWKNRLRRPHLDSLERAGRLRIWDDRKIDAGATWYPEIVRAMDRARAAILLISADYLESDFCVKEEVPYLLKRRAEEGVLVVPILIRPCPFETIEWLAPIQMLPRDGKSISGDFADDYDEVFAEAARCVEKAVRQRHVPGEEELTPTVSAPHAKWPAVPQDHVYIERLPVTAAELFGRSAELKALDAAWSEGELCIFSLVAWGGVGKSTLVNRWLDRMQADNFRGAERVFGWSFYSQGTGERVTSADQFIAYALAWFGDEDPTKGSPWAKGERLARLIAQHKTLLILDGMEPLQSAAGLERGRIRDPALAMLVRGLAHRNPGLCIITTREHVADVDKFRETVEQRSLDQISPEAGRALLRVRRVSGRDGDLEAAARAFGCHALAINLLGAFLRHIPDHPIKAAQTIPDLEIPDEMGRHPRRIVAAFEKHFGESAEIEVLRILGLFDRPATAGEFEEVLAKPPIRALTTHLRGMSHAARMEVIHRLRGVGLVAKESTRAPDQLDAHPIVREHFAEQVENGFPEAWKEGHGRLFKYLHGPGCGKKLPDTLEEMAPLFAAVIHGCRAGQHQRAFKEVLARRIRRWDEAYSIFKLGAFGADLSALSGFFEESWRRPVSALTASAQGFVLNEAGFDLRALGRLAEAMEPFLAALALREALQDWKNASVNASNVSELYLTLGDITKAVEIAERSVMHAELSRNPFQRLFCRTTLAAALHQAGAFRAAEAMFREAEKIQAEWDPWKPLLYSIQGWRYTDLLLDRGEYETVERRARRTLRFMLKDRTAPLLTLAVEELSLGRALMLESSRSRGRSYDEAEGHIEHAVELLREGGGLDYLPFGLIARAQVNGFIANHINARADLDEAMDIATRDSQGLMRLHITECHLGYARLALAQNDRETAQRHLILARDLIEETGYHRRDKELEGLEKQAGTAT